MAALKTARTKNEDPTWRHGSYQATLFTVKIALSGDNSVKST